MTENAATHSVDDGLPVSPILAAELRVEFPPVRRSDVDRRVVVIATLAMILGLIAVFVSQLLLRTIDLITNLAFFGRLSWEHASPIDNRLGLFVVFVPVVGAVVIGFLARYGSKAICGHGIPEAMEQVLTNHSRIPVRITLLKPLSAAISIGTGGPFGAEGPIIATGGALGSLVGQVLTVTAIERKTLLAAGAAAGMTAIFGTPLAAILLAVELLLFEYRPQSLIAVALATMVAAAGRLFLEGSSAVFTMPSLGAASMSALLVYLLAGIILGLASVLVTRVVYGVEDAFERLPIHWMWWPAIGSVVVGAIGYFAPQTLGVGYENITHLLSGSLPLRAVLVLGGLKFVSWAVSLGSGTSGGTLAPLLTIGGCCGATLGFFASEIAPAAAVDTRMATLVGMAALFAGASRAPMASALFAFEATRETNAIVPLLAGCMASYLTSCLCMRNSIMTEKIARRGIHTPTEYSADTLEQVLVRDAASLQPILLKADDTIASVRHWLASAAMGTEHQGFPVVDAHLNLVGVVTRKDLQGHQRDDRRLQEILGRAPIVIYDDCSVREAADQMVRHNIGRLPVVRRGQERELVAIITRSDVLNVYARRLQEREHGEPSRNVAR